MREEIRVILCGLGPIGLRVMEAMRRRSNLRLVGVLDIDPAKVGRDAGDLLDPPAARGVRVSGDIEALLRDVEAEVAVVTTTSALEGFAPTALRLMEAGLAVVSTCEELAHPWQTAPRLAGQLDAAARAARVGLLGAGVNPGFLMDLLPLVMTGPCLETRHVLVERIQDARFRRGPFQDKIGAGLTRAEFDQRAVAGAIRHVGLTESMQMIAARLGWRLDHVEESLRPIVAERRVVTDRLTVEPGRILGVDQRGRALIGQREVISLVFRAALAEPDPRDRIVIDGEPPIDLTLAGGLNGDIATTALVVNAIPAILEARPGLRTMADMEPVVCGWAGR